MKLEQMTAEERKELKRIMDKVRNGKARIAASVKHVSPSGMTRIIAFNVYYYSKKYGVTTYNLTWAIAKLGIANMTNSDKPYGVKKVNGSGMDMIFATLHNLHVELYGPRTNYNATTKYDTL